ncbi:hypothetical protein LJC32_07155 [Oscillospiraceae bacterium OttesenSCG-928-F05]|nr:hypothetical protein [Oscillospiraceae bacterium OttesenSCG-928-F05]
MSDYAGSALYGRKYKVIVATTGTTGIEVTNLHCLFTIEKSMTTDPNNSIIQIYNLAPNTQNEILTNSSRVIIEAGYDGPQYGLIFDGDIVRAMKRGGNSIDKITEIIAQDGDLFLNSGVISVSYAAGQTAEDTIRGMAGIADPDMSIGSLSENLSGTALARGKALFGQPKDYARSIAKGEEALFYVCDRKICLVKPMDLPTDEIVSLSPSSGLIGTPEQTEDGVKARCLLNPLLNLNKLVHIDNDLVQQDADMGALSTGVYKIIALTHKGDTRGQEWYTDFTGIAQPGMIPQTGSSFST